MNTKYYKKNNSMKTVSPKKKTIDRNQLLAYLLAVLIIFWTVAGIFGIIAFGRSSKKSSNVISANAQTVEDFQENHRLIITNPIKNFIVVDDTNSESMTTLFGYDFYFGDYDLGLLLEGTDFSFYRNTAQELNFSVWSTSYGTDLDDFDVRLSVADWVDYDEPWTSIDYSIYSESIIRNENRHLIFYHTFVFTDTNQGYSETVLFSFDYELTGFADDASLTVIFPNANAGLREWVVDESTYEGNAPVEGFDTTDFLLYYYSVDTDNFNIAFGNGYDKGYEQGLADAPTDNYDKGFRKGREIGKQEGFDEGFLEGVNSANEYTFDGLISAVFDVPVRTFFSFFSFEILGIDFSTFFLSLFAVAVFLAVVRFIF